MAKSFSFFLFFFLCAFGVIGSIARAAVVEHTFNVGNFTVKKLCQTSIVTVVNGQFPGPTIRVSEGDTLIVHVLNNSPYGITLHWHGVFQLLTVWADGPSYVTQCPIEPQTSYTYKFTVIGQEGTLWWHAHSSTLQATVHGALIIQPRAGANSYPFPIPHEEVPILLGQWWKANVIDLDTISYANGLVLNSSDALTINGSPGGASSCSDKDIFKLEVVPGKTYLLRIINSALNTELFFKVAGHSLNVVAADASYTVTYSTEVIFIAPGQSVDALMTANAAPGSYYMAASAYVAGFVANPFYDNTTTTGLVRYKNSPSGLTPIMPVMPLLNDTHTATMFFSSLTALLRPGSRTVPLQIDENIFMTFGLGMSLCGPDRPKCRLGYGSHMNNISFQLPTRGMVSLLEAKFKGIDGVFTIDFPNMPPNLFNFTDPAQSWNQSLLAMSEGTKVKKLRYNTTVEVVLQNTRTMALESHPIHLHGYNFFVVAQGFGNFDASSAAKGYNLVNPQERNTVSVPAGGWSVIRFRADNPGVWFMHCHLDKHMSIGLGMAFDVDNGPTEATTLRQPPADFPKCGNIKNKYVFESVSESSS